tara:strand:+ start:747 stop:1043 length:297 start_codon:yes stop_codon:yes gene_type:complete
MKKFIFTLIPTILCLPIGVHANDDFSVEIEALTLVMEKFQKESNSLSNIREPKPSYMAFKQDECNATVKVTEKNGLQMTTMESFDVNVCKKEINKIIN